MEAINEWKDKNCTSGTSGIIKAEREKCLENVEDKDSKLIKKIKNLQLQTKVFWMIIAALFGFMVGIYFAQDIIIGKMLDDAVKLKGIVIHSIPYDLKERI